MVILSEVRWGLTVVLVFISLAASSGEHVSTHLDICISYFEKCLFKSFAHINLIVVAVEKFFFLVPCIFWALITSLINFIPRYLCVCVCVCLM
jgi:hypothetical protein